MAVCCHCGIEIRSRAAAARMELAHTHKTTSSIIGEQQREEEDSHMMNYRDVRNVFALEFFFVSPARGVCNK
jgi:hypothetical protein